MKGPHIPHEVRDSKRKVKYIVMAYRQLTRDEMLEAVGAYLSQAKKKPAPRTTVTILTLYGSTPSL